MKKFTEILKLSDKITKDKIKNPNKVSLNQEILKDKIQEILSKEKNKKQLNGKNKRYFWNVIKK